jgi:tetratricopeptide (TPR) repeat protein
MQFGAAGLSGAVAHHVKRFGLDRFNLGSHSRPVSTTSPEAQRYFDLGLNWCYGFNQEEGVKCFEKALEFDPDCVMAHWGIAYGSGPFYNLTWREFGEKEANLFSKVACEHLEKARALAHRATEVENQLVEAQARRFQKPHAVTAEEYDRWNDDYAAAMRRVHYNYPDDDDVAALFMEALLMRTPRRLWDVKTGAPAKNSDIVEALDVCDRSTEKSEKAGRVRHPAIAHFHIHALEMSDFPERAMASADALAKMCPDAGHMNHMPGHIYVLCGEYEKARLTNEKAIIADDMYADYAGSHNFYVTARCHDLHLKTYTAMFQGRLQDALASTGKIRQMLTRDILEIKDRPKLAWSVEGYLSMRMHVLVRFGRWNDIIAEAMPDDPDLYVVSTPMLHYARGVAFATLKKFPEAERERELFHKTLARVPETRRFFNNTAPDMLRVGEKMLDGELEYHKGNYDEAFEHLRESVRRDDNLGYVEPWAWMHPPRHALAALLAEQGHYEEAEQVYRDDLGLSGIIQRCAQHPDNVWSLHGLVECLERRGDTRELPGLQKKLAVALSQADVPITSSCLCRLKVAQPSCCA